VTGTPAIAVNGKATALQSSPSSYAMITRQWRNGDRVDVTMAMDLHVHSMPDDPTLQAVMYGPLVLAGKLGPHVERAEATKPRMSPDFTEPQIAGVAAVKVPVIVTASDDVHSWVKPVPGKPLQFMTMGQATPVTLAPFNGVYDER